ncbi:MAG: hypothetical protein FD189_1318 [Elusimicrobia bacterium]|nr:MAG: hypothetical protein FD154_749 [Elusimicrobiota bacterium]KAF0155615.1 MAG: hypothetical protein FD189_1318 [Elusimicrobiota bacterium]
MNRTERRRGGGGRVVLALLMLLAGAFTAGYMTAERPAALAYGLHGPFPGAQPGSGRLKRSFYDAAARLKEHKNVLERSIEDRASAPPYGPDDIGALREELEKIESLLVPAMSAAMPEAIASQAAAAGQARRETLLACARMSVLVKGGEPGNSSRSRAAKTTLEREVDRLQHHLSGLARLLD